jgi:steroid delta-isomerase-like uncharacterized protein
MSTAANKALVRRFIDEVFLQGRLDAVDALLTEDFAAHTYGPGPFGRDELKVAVGRVSQGLADVSMTVEAMVAEDDMVAVRLTSSAVQVGAFMGLPPTGKRYEIGEIHLFRVRAGRIAEHWHEADFLGMMRQLGALPPPGGSSS